MPFPLTALRRAVARPQRRAARNLIRGIDFLWRRTQGVEKFTYEEGCILCVAFGRSGADQKLSDGMVIRRGERVGKLHLWNGHIPVMGSSGPDLTWGLISYSRFVRFLGALSIFADGDERFDEIRAFRGEMAFARADAEKRAQRIARAFGFDFVRVPYSASRWGRFVEIWKNIYSWLLIWTFNPASLRGKGLLQLRRYQLWISREALRTRYAPLVAGGRDEAARALANRDLSDAQDGLAAPCPP
jgi:hypothetical protein